MAEQMGTTRPGEALSGAGRDVVTLRLPAARASFRSTSRNGHCFSPRTHLAKPVPRDVSWSSKVRSWMVTTRSSSG